MKIDAAARVEGVSLQKDGTVCFVTYSELLTHMKLPLQDLLGAIERVFSEPESIEFNVLTPMFIAEFVSPKVRIFHLKGTPHKYVPEPQYVLEIQEGENVLRLVCSQGKLQSLQAMLRERITSTEGEWPARSQVNSDAGEL